MLGYWWFVYLMNVSHGRNIAALRFLVTRIFMIFKWINSSRNLEENSFLPRTWLHMSVCVCAGTLRGYWPNGHGFIGWRSKWPCFETYNALRFYWFCFWFYHTTIHWCLIVMISTQRSARNITTNKLMHHSAIVRQFRKTLFAVHFLWSWRGRSVVENHIFDLFMI